MLGRGHHRDWELSLYSTLRAIPLITIYFNFVSYLILDLLGRFYQGNEKALDFIDKENYIYIHVCWYLIIKSSLNPKFWRSKLRVWCYYFFDLESRYFRMSHYCLRVALDNPPAAPSPHLAGGPRVSARGSRENCGWWWWWWALQCDGAVRAGARCLVSSGYTEREMRTTRRCSGEQQSHFSDLTSGPTIRDAGAGDHSCPGSRYLSLHNNYRNLTLQFLF